MTVAAKHDVRATGDTFRAATGGALGVLNSSEAPQSGVRTRVLPADATRCHDVPKHTQPPMKWQDVACAGSVVQAGADTTEVTGSGPDRARTDYLFHAMEALSQMSYRPREVT